MASPLVCSTSHPSDADWCLAIECYSRFASSGLFASPGPDFAAATSWTFVKGSAAAASVARLAVAIPGASPGRLWATTETAGVWSGVLAAGGGSVMWDIKGALQFSQKSGGAVPYSGLAVLPGSGGADITVMTMLSDSNTSIWRTADSGGTWSRLPFTVSDAPKWWGAGRNFMTGLNAATSLAFDPRAAVPTLWATDFFGVYAAAVPPAGSAVTLAFSAVEAGHEEVCVNFVKAPAIGDVVTGGADVGGWRLNNGLATWPDATIKAADGWAHNCAFDASLTTKVSSSGASVDAIWVTAGDEYGSCAATSTSFWNQFSPLH